MREGGPPTSSPLWRQADESRLKSLNLQLEKTLAQARAALGADSRREPPPLEPPSGDACPQVAERQAELEAEVTKTSVQQVELDRTADDYRALQRERRGLLLQSRSGATASPHPTPPPAPPRGDWPGESWSSSGRCRSRRCRSATRRARARAALTALPTHLCPTPSALPRPSLDP